MADQVMVFQASKVTGINMTSITNAAVSGDLEWTMHTNGQMVVSLSAVQALAAAAGIRP